MPELRVNKEAVTKEAALELVSLCPFGAFDYIDGVLSVSAACKMCGLCVKKGPAGVVELVKDDVKPRGENKDNWNGIAVFAEQRAGKISPVVFELLGKGRELADKTGQPLYAYLAGHGMEKTARELARYGADRVFVHDDKGLEHFRVLPYASAFEQFIKTVKPSAVLVGATNLGRSLAPRVAARFRTGLTADCTRLEIKDNKDIVQIRPAFGGNIMAQIVTPDNRPQFCTVRYKIFDMPKPGDSTSEIVKLEFSGAGLSGVSEVLEVVENKSDMDISEAEAIVAIGRGLKSQKDLDLARELAQALNAQLACTRPLIENGWMNGKCQIGLSGRTVKPKIIITLGISGSVQFAAGMKSSDCIIAINDDPNAQIFSLANYCIVGDIYSVVPLLLEKIKTAKGEA